MGKYSYGFKPQKPDSRDIHYSTFRSVFGQLAPVYDLTPQIPYIFDQLALGSCTGNATSKAIRYAREKAGLDSFNPSRLSLYYNARRQEGSINSDDGAIIRDVFRGANEWGYADEKLWPYRISMFAQDPPKSFYEEAEKNKIHLYAWVNNAHVDNIKLALSHGYPVVFGIQLYGNFEEYTSGVIPMPDTTTQQYLGSHCMDITGCDDHKRAFRFDNSWSEEWGEKGRGWLSYDYITSNLASDFWMVRLK